MKTVWCTKRALTEVISEREVIKFEGRYAHVKWPGKLNGWAMMGRGDWYPTLEQAQARVDRMRKDKIKSLQKQIEKLSTYVPMVLTLNLRSDGNVDEEVLP